MSILQISLFGSVRASLNNWQTDIMMTREIQGLLAYLTLHRHHMHSRDALAVIFWGEHSQERARGSLNTALWKLRKALEPKGIRAGTYIKNAHLAGVSFNKDSQYWLDVEVFEEKISRILICPVQAAKTSQAIDLEKALKLYKGELLEGFYADWALQERERIRALYVRSLIYLLQYHGLHRSYDKAISYGQQIVELDPLREEIHRDMMRFYVKNGQRALAVKQYETCRIALAKDLGISPMEETQELSEQILTEPRKNRSIMNSKQEVSLDQALHQLTVASVTVDLAKEQIQAVLQLIAKYSEHLG